MRRLCRLSQNVNGTACAVQWNAGVLAGWPAGVPRLRSAAAARTPPGQPPETAAFLMCAAACSDHGAQRKAEALPPHSTTTTPFERDHDMEAGYHSSMEIGVARCSFREESDADPDNCSTHFCVVRFDLETLERSRR